MRATPAINNIYKLISFLELMSINAAVSEIQRLEHSASLEIVVKGYRPKYA